MRLVASTFLRADAHVKLLTLPLAHTHLAIDESIGLFNLAHRLEILSAVVQRGEADELLDLVLAAADGQGAAG